MHIAMAAMTAIPIINTQKGKQTCTRLLSPNDIHSLGYRDFLISSCVALFDTPKTKITTTLLGVSDDFKPLDLTTQNLSRLKSAYNL